MTLKNQLADNIARIINATRNRKQEVELLRSKKMMSIASLLRKHGFIRNYRMCTSTITIQLKYSKDQSVMKDIKYHSHLDTKNILSFAQLTQLTQNQTTSLGGLSLLVLSTPLGILTNVECLKKKIGGNLLLKVS